MNAIVKRATKVLLLGGVLAFATSASAGVVYGSKWDYHYSYPSYYNYCPTDGGGGYTGGGSRSVPEPTTLALFGAGLLGLRIARRRRSKASAK